MKYQARWYIACLVPDCGMRVTVQEQVCATHRFAPQMLKALKEIQGIVEALVISMTEQK